MYQRRLVVLAVSNLNCRQILTDVLKNWGLEAVAVSTVRSALALLDDPDVALIFCEGNLVDGSFRELLKAASSRRPPLRLVALVHAEKDYSDAIRLGAFDAIPVSCRRSDLQWMMINALRDRNDSANEYPRAELSDQAAWPQHSPNPANPAADFRRPESHAQNSSSTADVERRGV
jgi:DNA-binding NtrC family response regulator